MEIVFGSTSGQCGNRVVSIFLCTYILWVSSMVLCRSVSDSTSCFSRKIKLRGYPCIVTYLGVKVTQQFMSNTCNLIKMEADSEHWYSWAITCMIHHNTVWHPPTVAHCVATSPRQKHMDKPELMHHEKSLSPSLQLSNSPPFTQMLTNTFRCKVKNVKLKMDKLWNCDKHWGKLFNSSDVKGNGWALEKDDK